VVPKKTMNTNKKSNADENSGTQELKAPVVPTEEQWDALLTIADKTRYEELWRAKVVVEAGQMGFDACAAELLGDLFVAARKSRNL